MGRRKKACEVKEGHDPSLIDEMVGKLIKKWVQIDILVNNAGIWTNGEVGKVDEAMLGPSQVRFSM